MPRIAKLLLEHKANPNAIQSEGNTPLHIACLKGDLKVVQLLLKYGADPNIRNHVARRTPLHSAVEEDYKEIVSVLMKKGAYGGAKDHFCKTPKDYARTKEMEMILKEYDYVKDRYSKTTIENKENEGPRQRSVSANDFDVFNDCIKKAKEEIDKQIIDKNLIEPFPDYLAKDLETLREENSYLESTDRHHIKLEVSQSFEDSPKIKDYEKVIKNKSPKSISVDCYLAKLNNKKVYDMPLKLDTSSELYIRINGKPNKGIKSLNMNYFAETNYTSHAFSEAPFDIKKNQYMKPMIFKSQRNDIPTYINERKRLNLNKTDNKIVTDIYNEVLNQMQNLSRIDSSLEYGDSISLDILEETERQVEDDVFQLDCPFDHDAISLKAFPVVNSGLHLLSTIRSSTNIFNNELDEWLGRYKLDKIKPLLRREGLDTKEKLIKYFNGKSYDILQNLLKDKGINKRGLRDRILMAINIATGKYTQDLLKIIKTFTNNYPEHISLSKKYEKPIPTLKTWLKDQKLEGLFPLFIKAGYDDYESILSQMCSLHPITNEILKNDAGISQPLIRSQVLYKLTEGIFILIV